MSVKIPENMEWKIKEPVKLSSEGLLTTTGSDITIASDAFSINNPTSDWDVFTNFLSHAEPAVKTVRRSYWESIENDFINAAQSLGFEHSIEITAPPRPYNPATTTVRQDSLRVYLKRANQVPEVGNDIALIIDVQPDSEWQITESITEDFRDQLKDL
jgi:hypothetical protein